MRLNGSGFPVLLLVAALALTAAGCGGDTEEPTTAATGAVAEVEGAIRDLGTTQEISCESVGNVALGGGEQEVVRCSFSEEENMAGDMRPRAGCFVVEEGTLREVTDEVPGDVVCVVGS
jgi:hypothetical protein